MLAGATYRNIAKPSALPLNSKEISGPAFLTIQICKTGQNYLNPGAVEGTLRKRCSGPQEQQREEFPYKVPA